jgi:predicted phage baseplate assembly protein
VGGGARGNVAADSITRVDPSATPAGLRVTNPFPAQGGADEEPDERVRRLAPQAFRARQFRAVLPSDYERAAESLAWVQKAGTTFRWTGSWLTVFTTVDPLGREEIPVGEHTQLIDLLNRYRLAGYESYAPAPRYASLDLVVLVCARPEAFRGDVEAAVLDALGTRRRLDGTRGFFNVDRFTFGTPLERSSLEGAIQSAQGVAGVVSILYRQRGRVPVLIQMPATVRVRGDEILRVDNDPSRPERGSLKVIVSGGK